MAALCLLMVAACSGLSAGGPASSARTSSPAPHQQATNRTLWILPAVGLEVHTKPSLTSQDVYTLGSGAQVKAIAQERVQGHDWLHIKDKGVNGWIVDSPQYEIDRQMSSYSLGGTLTMLYPTTWSLQAGNPAIITAPSGDPTGGTLHLQSAAQASTLPSVPMTAGTEDTSKEVSTSVDGISSEVFVYLTNGGGTEYFVERKLGTLVYLIDLQQPQANPDTTFFLQLLSSVNAQFPNPSPSPSPSPS